MVSIFCFKDVTELKFGIWLRGNGIVFCVQRAHDSMCSLDKVLI